MCATHSLCGCATHSLCRVGLVLSVCVCWCASLYSSPKSLGIDHIWTYKSSYHMFTLFSYVQFSLSNSLFGFNTFFYYLFGEGGISSVFRLLLLMHLCLSALFFMRVSILYLSDIFLSYSLERERLRSEWLKDDPLLETVIQSRGPYFCSTSGSQMKRSRT